MRSSMSSWSRSACTAREWKKKWSENWKRGSESCDRRLSSTTVWINITRIWSRAWTWWRPITSCLIICRNRKLSKGTSERCNITKRLHERDQAIVDSLTLMTTFKCKGRHITWQGQGRGSSRNTFKTRSWEIWKHTKVIYENLTIATRSRKN